MLVPLQWEEDKPCLRVLDQRLLPGENRWLVCENSRQVADAIHVMAVRGAPAIGIAAAWGVVLALHEVAGREDWSAALQERLSQLAGARPTAVNLHWAITATQRQIAGCETAAAALAVAGRLAAHIQAADLAANQRIGELGAALLPERARVLTHCNTGALATGGHGTALGVVRTAWSSGRLQSVMATETRPWLQGLRLTSWELAEDGIPVTLIVDSAAAAMMQAGEVDAVIIGADRITRRGDVANKIGSYALALAARAHKIPFYVAAPASTVDVSLESGEDIEIEDREAGEIWRAAGLEHGIAGVRTRNPAFDVTPASLVTAIITENGVSWPASGEGMELLAEPARP
ncbi:S-methyl-5-thioribose-1-phosphate isomerase [Natronospira bacteriovora]|uniref:Methylthioribose-1-phosphate isomerase n=1 Tax=Natronospira bacteriovora TaxID=3069753 RepID=A0ABU0W580_9GAMM|nr:S-methyl-5-thioribose-1-phosphate isomerase [Natronospira sp. AB-CW4]MDQ2069177.1 S-methyl-5-thioribose-1-phosphate isomerase [Natronospira sp. AB-CW4]